MRLTSFYPAFIDACIDGAHDLAMQHPDPFSDEYYEAFMLAVRAQLNGGEL